MSRRPTKNLDGLTRRARLGAAEDAEADPGLKVTAGPGEGEGEKAPITDRKGANRRRMALGGKKLSLRLGTEERRALIEKAEALGMSPSQLGRMFLRNGLRGEASFDDAWKKSAFREGVTLGLRKFREQAMKMVDQTLQGIDDLDMEGE